MLIPAENTYMAMIQNPELPSHFGESYPWTSTRPVVLTLSEYHCISPEEPADFRGVTVENPDDEGVKNAYLPHLDMLVEDVSSFRGRFAILDTYSITGLCGLFQICPGRRRTYSPSV